MKKINKKSLIVFVMLLVTISVIAISNIISSAVSSSTKISLKFSNLGYTTEAKTGKEWKENYTEPTIIEKDSDGNCYIIWAVNDPKKTNDTCYSTIGYRIHTKPASGSANKMNYGGFDGKNKLLASVELYGKTSEMGEVITIWRKDAFNEPGAYTEPALGKYDSFNLDTIEQEIDGKTYFFRLIKLTEDQLKNGLGYESGPLYFSGIMRNYDRGKIKTEKAMTYKEWSKDGMHNLVTSSETRKGFALPQGGTIEAEELGGMSYEAPYIYVINNHYDRIINTDKAVENKNVQVKVYINGELQPERSMTEVKILTGTEVKLNDDNKKIKLDVSGRDPQEQVSPVAEGYQFKEARLDGATYYFNITTKVDEKDRVFELYYEGIPKTYVDTIVYCIKEGTDYRNSDNYLKDKLIIEGVEANTEQYISVSQALTKKEKSYEFLKAYTIGQDNEMNSYSSIYRYIAGEKSTEIVIEYKEKPIDGEEKELDYEDESLSAFAYGHILQDTTKDGESYNVQKGIPTNRHIYSHAQANGYLYKIKGKCVTGNKPHEVIYYSKNTDTSTGIVTLTTRTGYVKNEYSFYTIDQFEILGLDEMYITNDILTGGQNIFEVNDLKINLIGNVGSMLSSEERYSAYVARTESSKDIERDTLTRYIKELNDHNRTIANEENAKRLEEINKDLPEEEQLSVLPEEERMQYTKYSISDFSFSDSTFYVMEDSEFGTLSTSDAEALAKTYIEGGLVEESDYIEVIAPSVSEKMKIESSYGGISYIKPESNFALLKYDLNDIYVSDTLVDDYENGGALSWFEKLLKIIGDFTQKVIDSIKDAWNSFWKLIRGEGEDNPPLIEEVIKEYNDTMQKYNELSRDVYRVLAYQDGQKIIGTKENGEYKTTVSGVTYKKVASNADLISQEMEDNPQQMNGLTVLTDIPKSMGGYTPEKERLLSTGVYIAEKVNDVYVHTPIYVAAELKNVDASVIETQYVNESSLDSNVNVVKVGEEYKIKLTTTGQHRDILGYGNKNYWEFIKNDNAQIRFPYDIYVKRTPASEYELFRANAWYDIGNASNITIKIPEWAEVPSEETEKLNGVVYYDIRISAINEPEDADSIELGWENANYDSGNPFRKIYNDVPKDYRAHARIPIYAVGKIYDFRVNFTNDQQYLATYNSGKMKDLDGNYKDDGFSIKNLPIGKQGTNEANPTYTKAVKLGNKFKFNVKTLGWKTNKVEIKPSFYFIPKDKTKTASKVDAWYQDINTGKYVKLLDDNKYKLNTTLPFTSSKVPNSSQIVTEPGPNSARVSATNKVRDAYATGYLYQFAPSYLNRVTSAKKTSIGNLGRIVLDEEERFRLNFNTNELKKMASNSIWYGEYKLPSTSKFVKEGKKYTEENILKKTDGDGYILVCFEIVGQYSVGNNDYPYLSYQKNLGSGSQWTEEGYDNANIKLVNGIEYNLPGTSVSHVGVFLYEAFENNGEDVVNPH